MIAMGTLTVFRVPIADEVSSRELSASTSFYPLAGLLIGIIPYLIFSFTGSVFSTTLSVTSAIALVAWIAATGALHLDGFADCCDAALAPWRGSHEAGIPGTERIEQEQKWRKSILKDPHIGVFGVVGLISLLAVKWSAIASIGSDGNTEVFLIAGITGRYAAVLTLNYFAPVKESGLAAAFRGKSSVYGATILAIVLFVMVLLVSNTSHQITHIAFSIVLAITVSLITAGWLNKKFGGINGDVCGTTVELSELSVLLCMAANL